MSAAADPRPDRPWLSATGVRLLRPETSRVFEGAFTLLHCVVAPHDHYRGVFAVRMFPIRFPDQFISLRYTDEKDRICEIGIIEQLAAFPADAQQLIRASVAKQYYEQVITRVHEVKSEYGLLFFDVDTLHGRRAFVIPWRHDRAEDYGENGKVLLDAHDNRYIIPDLDALPAKDRRRFTTFIYW